MLGLCINTNNLKAEFLTGQHASNGKRKDLYFPVYLQKSCTNFNNLPLAKNDLVNLVIQYSNL